MVKEDTQSSQLNLTVVALVALVAIVGLVALVINISGSKPLAKGMQVVSASSQDVAQAQKEANIGGQVTCAHLNDIVLNVDNGYGNIQQSAASRLLAWGACN